MTQEREKAVEVEIVSEELTKLSQASPLLGEVPMTEDEEGDLLNLERKVERAFYEAGQALAEIRERRLYRRTHPTFEAYCQERFQFSRRHVNYLIAAVEVVDNLIMGTSRSQNYLVDEMGTNGSQNHLVDEMGTTRSQILPSSEFQIRPLAQLEPERQREAWQQAIEEAGGKIPPARVVKSIVERLREKSRVPNPWRKGDVAEIVVKENPDLRGRGGCWAIVTEVYDFSCAVRMFDGEYQVKIENLKDLALPPQQQEEVRRLGERLNRLTAIAELDRSAKVLLSHLGRQTFLTSIEERLLKALEECSSIN